MSQNLEKMKYSNDNILSLANLIKSDYIVLLTNGLLSNSDHQILEDLKALNIHNIIYTKNMGLLILVKKQEIRFIIPIIIAYNPEDMFIFNLSDISKWEICSNLKWLNPKYLLKNHISDITLSLAFLEQECEICLALEKHNISDIIDHLNQITS